jgi:hypothetical protein
MMLVKGARLGAPLEWSVRKRKEKVKLRKKDAGMSKKNLMQEELGRINYLLSEFNI